jgi:PAS domain S-box-containing protein
VNAEPPLPSDGADWSTLFELLPIGAYRSTPDGRQLRANPALVRLNGYASEAEQIAAVRDIAVEWYVDPSRRAEFRRMLDTDGRVQGFVSEVWRHRTRERIWVSENAHVVRDADGGVLHYEGTVEEITDRVRDQQALEHWTAQFSVIARQVPGVVYRVRMAPDGTPCFDFISAGVRDIYGVEPEEVMHDGRLLQRMRHPDDHARMEASLQSIDQHPATVHSDELRIVRRDGQVRWVRATVTPVRGADGTMERCGVIIDITERQTAQALRAERDRAEASRQATIGLLSRISHELRTPLNAMLGFTQLLARDDTLGQTQRRFADEALRAGRHLLALVDDVSDLSLAETGAFTLHLADADPAQALGASQGLLAAEAQAAGVELRLPQGPLPRVRADPNRLRQVLTNLMSNAIKFNRRGGEVRVAVDRVGTDRVALAVHDTGPGLSDAQQARLFQPFERLGAPQQRVPGTGLGLALSRQLARAMGGEIKLRSAPGQGACFTLLLPAA